MCSKKCASPGVGRGSWAAPTLTLSAAAAFSVRGSDTTMARSRLGSRMRRYCRSSCGLTCSPPNSRSRHRSVCGVRSAAQRRALKEEDKHARAEEGPPPLLPRRIEAASIPDSEVLLTLRGVPPLLPPPPPLPVPPKDGERPRERPEWCELERGRRPSSDGPMPGVGAAAAPAAASPPPSVSSGSAKSSWYHEGRLLRLPLPALPSEVKE